MRCQDQHSGLIKLVFGFKKKILYKTYVIFYLHHSFSSNLNLLIAPTHTETSVG